MNVPRGPITVTGLTASVPTHLDPLLVPVGLVILVMEKPATKVSGRFYLSNNTNTNINTNTFKNVHKRKNRFHPFNSLYQVGQKNEPPKQS